MPVMPMWTGLESLKLKNKVLSLSLIFFRSGGYGLSH